MPNVRRRVAGSTTGLKTRTSPFGDENGRWRNSGAQSRYRNLPRSILQSKITSTRNAISTAAKSSNSTAPPRLPSGVNWLSEKPRRRSNLVPTWFPLTPPCRLLPKPLSTPNWRRPSLQRLHRQLRLHRQRRQRQTAPRPPPRCRTNRRSPTCGRSMWRGREWRGRGQCRSSRPALDQPDLDQPRPNRMGPEMRRMATAPPTVPAAPS